MKKISLLFILLLLASFVANASELSQKAINMRTQIKSYLSSQGYTPTIDSDGDIAFTYDGGKFWIAFQDYQGAVAVSLTKYYNNDIQMSTTALENICIDMTKEYIIAKIYLTSNASSIVIRSAALYDTAAQFNSVFDSNLWVVSLVSKEFLERANR